MSDAWEADIKRSASDAYHIISAESLVASPLTMTAIVVDWPHEELKALMSLSDVLDVCQPLLYVRVAQEDTGSQAPLHRYLALRNYVPDLLDHSEQGDYWRFHHPTGRRSL